jgi:hypothetical protein
MFHIPMLLICWSSPQGMLSGGRLGDRAHVLQIDHATRAAVEEGILPGGGVALLRAGWKAELGERRGEAEALRSCRKSFLGATVRCSRRFHLRSKARSRSSGY